MCEINFTRIWRMSRKGYNFCVKERPSRRKRTVEESNNILVSAFIKKWKKSGILKEIKDKSAPITKGQKNRRKRYLGKRRSNKKNS
jgi:hypothetical protein